MHVTIVGQNHKQICTLKMLFISICYSSLLQVASWYSAEIDPFHVYVNEVELEGKVMFTSDV